MRRHLFLLHLRRLFTAAMIVCVSILAVLLVVERLVMSTAGQGAAQVPETVNLFILITLLGACFPAGAASFGKAFRDQQALFLYSLPLPRLETWAILTSAAATSHLLVIAFVFLVRPSLVGVFTGAEAESYVLSILIALVVFAAGACFGLAAPRPVVAGATALLLLGPSIGLVFFVSADRYSVHQSPDRALADPIMFVGLVLVSAVFLGLSALFFRRGEHELATQTVVRYASIVGGVVVAALVLRAIAATFDAGRPIEATQITLSPAGGRIAVVEHHPRLRRARLRVFDARTGRELFNRRSSVLLAEWTAEDRLLLVESSGSAASVILPISFASRAMLLGADGMIEKTLELPHAVNAGLPAIRGGEAPIFLVTSFFRGVERHSIYRIDGTAFTSLRSGEQWANLVRRRATGERLIAASAETGMRIFRDADAGEELPRNGDPRADRNAQVYVLDGTVHMTEKDVVPALHASYPISDEIRAAKVARGSTGGYVVTGDSWRVRFLDPVWYHIPPSGSARGLLWEWNGGRWARVTDALEAPRNRPRPAAGDSGLVELPNSATQAPGGALLFARGAGNGSDLVVASVAGEHSIAHSKIRNPNVHIQPWLGEGGTAVVVVVGDEKGEMFVYDPSARSLTPVAPRVGKGSMSTPMLRVKADGSRIEFAMELSPEEAARAHQPDVDGHSPPPRRPSYRIVETRPDGSRKVVRLGADR